MFLECGRELEYDCFIFVKLDLDYGFVSGILSTIQGVLGQSVGSIEA